MKAPAPIPAKTKNNGIRIANIIPTLGFGSSLGDCPSSQFAPEKPASQEQTFWETHFPWLLQFAEQVTATSHQSPDQPELQVHIPDLQDPCPLHVVAVQAKQAEVTLSSSKHPKSYVFWIPAQIVFILRQPFADFSLTSTPDHTKQLVHSPVVFSQMLEPVITFLKFAMVMSRL
jgi:hypothetical protein